MHEFISGTRLAFRSPYQRDSESSPDAPATPDDDALFRLARQHRVAGLWSATLHPDWRPYARGQLVHLARCELDGSELLSALSEHDPDAFMLKGPVLAMQAWHDPALRHYDDVDLRCRRIRFEVLASVMGAAGYQPEHTDKQRSAWLWHFGWGVGFANASGLRIECNWRWFPPPYSRLEHCLSFPDAVSDILISGEVRVRGASPAAHLLYGCMHVIWHHWARLGWLVDVAGLLMRHPDALPQARRTAGSCGFVREALETVCGVADALLGPLPGTFRIPPPLQLDAIRKRLTSPHDCGGLAAERAGHLGHLGRRERLCYQLKRLLIPGDADFARWSLPAGAGCLYWFLRPCRLVRAGRMHSRSHGRVNS